MTMHSPCMAMLQIDMAMHGSCMVHAWSMHGVTWSMHGHAWDYMAHAWEHMESQFGHQIMDLIKTFNLMGKYLAMFLWDLAFSQVTISLVTFVECLAGDIW